MKRGDDVFIRGKVMTVSSDELVVAPYAHRNGEGSVAVKFEDVLAAPHTQGEQPLTDFERRLYGVDAELLQQSYEGAAATAERTPSHICSHGKAWWQCEIADCEAMKQFEQELKPPTDRTPKWETPLPVEGWLTPEWVQEVLQEYAPKQAEKMGWQTLKQIAEALAMPGQVAAERTDADAIEPGLAEAYAERTVAGQPTRRLRHTDCVNRWASMCVDCQEAIRLNFADRQPAPQQETVEVGKGAMVTGEQIHQWKRDAFQRGVEAERVTTYQHAIKICEAFELSGGNINDVKNELREQVARAEAIRSGAGDKP